MLSVYISNTFIEEFYLRADFTSEVVYDFYYLFIKKARGVKIFIDTDDINKLYELSDINEFYNDLLEINPSIKCDKTWMSQINDEVFLKDGDPSKLFLLSNDLDCDLLTEKHNFLFINNNNLIKQWTKVRINRDISEMTPGNDRSNAFCFYDWNQINQFSHPFNQMLILDLFILRNDTNQRIENNLTPLLQCLCAYNPNGPQRTTIISNCICSDNKKDKSNKYIEKAFSLVANNISLKDFKIIYYDDKTVAVNKQIKDEHDREIITNYLVYSCGAGWNIFKDNGDVNHRTTITIRSIFKNDVRNSVETAINNFKEYYQIIKQPQKEFVFGKIDPDGKLATKEVYYHFPTETEPCFL